MPTTPHPHLAAIGQNMVRAFQRHLDNDALRDAFAELAFEVELSRQIPATSQPAYLVDHGR